MTAKGRPLESFSVAAHDLFQIATRLAGFDRATLFKEIIRLQRGSGRKISERTVLNAMQIISDRWARTGTQADVMPNPRKQEIIHGDPQVVAKKLAKAEMRTFPEDPGYVISQFLTRLENNRNERMRYIFLLAAQEVQWRTAKKESKGRSFTPQAALEFMAARGFAVGTQRPSGSVTFQFVDRRGYQDSVAETAPTDRPGIFVIDWIW